MAGPSRLKDGVASARLCPAIHVFLVARLKDVDARDKAGHDDLREERGKKNTYSVTAFSEICQSLPSKFEMWSVFIGE